MRMRPNTLAVASFLLLCSSYSFTQQVSSPASAEPVGLSVVVTPSNHTQQIAGLQQSSFTVLDNGAPRPIQSFRAVTAQADPVKVLLVVDAVNVPYVRVAYERDEIARFLKAKDGQLAQPTAVAILTDTGTQVEPSFSTNGIAINQALEQQTIGLRDLRRSSGFYGAEERLDISLKALSGLVARAQTQPGRKFIIWVSPGWPLLSGPDIQLSGKEQQNLFNQVIAFSDALRKAKTTLYVVNPLGPGADPGREFYYKDFVKGVTKPSQTAPADLGLQVLAEQSGGKVLLGSNDISAMLSQCVADATARYEITFEPAPSDAPVEFHKIEVNVADTNLKARTLTGYYTHP